MKNIFMWVGGVILALVIVFVGLNAYMRSTSPAPTAAQTAKEATFTIDGKPVKVGEAGVQYFGNSVTADLNGDGVADEAFLITYDGGGSGTFYYVVAALKTQGGWQGTNAILLGDRIAPQTSEFTGGALIINFAGRAPTESFSTAPHIGMSAHLHVSGGTLIETLND